MSGFSDKVARATGDVTSPLAQLLALKVRAKYFAVGAMVMERRKPSDSGELSETRNKTFRGPARGGNAESQLSNRGE